MIALLNRYFDCQVPVIDAHGGEVLKFMGDGLLAIFPTEPAGPAQTCAAALAAARAARAAIVELAREMADDAAPRLPFGLALHVGDVLYGNVGGGSRLDFTVIGPAVNVALRLEHATRHFDRSVLVSAAFAAVCGKALVPLGDHVLRGIALAQPVFGLPEESAGTIDATPPIVDS